MLKTKSYKLIPWKVIAAGCCLLIAVGSLLPQGTVADLDVQVSGSGFVEHALVYGLLGFSVARGFTRLSAAVVLSLMCLLGVFFEWIQMVFLQRTFNPYDVLANILGILAGLALARLWSLLFVRPEKET
ncbi:MAG: VanZ family protein [Desulfovermiculus sp.]